MTQKPMLRVEVERIDTIEERAKWLQSDFRIILLGQGEERDALGRWLLRSTVLGGHGPDVVPYVVLHLVGAHGVHHALTQDSRRDATLCGVIVFDNPLHLRANLVLSELVGNVSLAEDLKVAREIGERMARHQAGYHVAVAVGVRD